jgi:hypothetical protein
MLSSGTRAQVMHGTAKKTSGGLMKKDLMYKNGRIVSVKASKTAKKRAMKGKFAEYVKLAKANKGKKGFVAMTKSMLKKSSKSKTQKRKRTSKRK